MEKYTKKIEIMKTSIDTMKEKSNRLISICGKFRTVILKSGEKIELVGKRQWDKWSKNNDYVTDF